MLETRLSEPELLLDPARAQHNIARMAARAHAAGVRLRPHFKTHQSRTVGRWFRAAGVDAITVSSLAMAEYFADDGWRDITIAFPFHPGMLARVESLARRLTLGITIADAQALDDIRIDAALDVWLKIDVGSGRTGFPHADSDAISAIARTLAARDDVHLRGLLAHAGHSYGARGAEAVLEVHEQTLTAMRGLRALLQPAVGKLELSVGDTPTCSIAERFPGIDEIRPGNFVFYDLSQWQIGSCSASEIAVAMACPVVARHPERGQLVVHGGAVHFSKDSIELDGERIYGLALEPRSQSWDGLQLQTRLIALSQEHGVVAAPAAVIATTRPGDTLLFAPVHSCLTADAMGRYRSLVGDRIEMLAKAGGEGRSEE